MSKCGLFLSIILLAVTARCTVAKSFSEHRLSRREAYPDVNYDDAALAMGDEAEQNDAEAGDDDDDNVVVQQRVISAAEHFHVLLGKTVRLPCAVSPVQITNQAVLQWKKNEDLWFLGTVNVIGSARATVSNGDLILKEVEAADAGNYTCSIIGGNSVHHELSIQEPAKIIELTASGQGQVFENSDLVINCSTRGSPPPTIIWSKENGNNNIRLQEKDAEFEGNSLIIRKVKHEQEGTYICYASNNVGPKPAASKIRITVLGKPYVHVHKEVVNTKPGVEAILQCSTRKQPKSQFIWLKDGKPVEEVEDMYMISTMDQKSNLTIVPRVDHDFGTYTCVAENQYGKHYRSVKLVQEPVIESLDVKGPTLSWTINSHLPLKEVELQFKPLNGTEWQTMSVPVPEIPAGETHEYRLSHELKDLDAGKYLANVRAKNEYNWSEHSKHVLTEIAPKAASVVKAGVLGGSGTSVQPSSVIMSSVLMYILIRFF